MFGFTVAEIEIPVPWGHVAAKTWGDQKDPPVLVVHGIMDNAGSFDHIIPLLPNSFYYICIDLPGHGLSSHFPAHLPIFSLNYVIVYKLIAEYFKRKRYIIMGHSYGGQLGLEFTLLYPQYVEKLILLDTATLLPILTRHFKNFFTERFDNFLRIEEKFVSQQGPPLYTYEEAVDKIQFGRYSPITTETAIALSHRALVPVENGKYKFSLDQRIKQAINPERDFRYIIKILKEERLTCPILMIMGKQSKVQQKYMKPVLSYLKALKNVTFKMVEGDHDVHSDYPELVAPHVRKFLLNKKGKL